MAVVDLRQPAVGSLANRGRHLLRPRTQFVARRFRKQEIVDEADQSAEQAGPNLPGGPTPNAVSEGRCGPLGLSVTKSVLGSIGDPYEPAGRRRHLPVDGNFCGNTGSGACLENAIPEKPAQANEGAKRLPYHNLKASEPMSGTPTGPGAAVPLQAAPAPGELPQFA